MNRNNNESNKPGGLVSSVSYVLLDNLSASDTLNIRSGESSGNSSCNGTGGSSSIDMGYEFSEMASQDGDSVVEEEFQGTPSSKDGRKKSGRKKIRIEFIENKSRRHITFSKRKHGIMKKAYELSKLTGTQILLLVASETGHVYTFATPKLQPMITKSEGMNLIQTYLNTPDNCGESCNQYEDKNFQGSPIPNKFSTGKIMEGRDFSMNGQLGTAQQGSPCILNSPNIHHPSMIGGQVLDGQHPGFSTCYHHDQSQIFGNSVVFQSQPNMNPYQNYPISPNMRRASPFVRSKYWGQGHGIDQGANMEKFNPSIMSQDSHSNTSSSKK